MPPMKRCLAAFAIAASLFAPLAHADDALEAKVRAYVPVVSLAKVDLHAYLEEIDLHLEVRPDLF